MTDYWNYFTSFLQEQFGLDAHRAAQVLATVMVILVYIVAVRAFDLFTHRKVGDVSRQYIVRKIFRFVLAIILMIAMLKIWVGTWKGFAAYIGILSAGLAIALQDPLTNLAGGLFIATRKPFSVGDRIQVGDIQGDVIDLRLFQFTVVEIGNWVNADQSTGRLIHIPNRMVFREAQANATEGFNFIWNEIPITVTFESNWELAKELLTAIANEHNAVQSEKARQEIRKAARKYMILYQHLTPIVWTSIADVGVTLTIRYLCEARARRSTQARVCEAILKAFAQADNIDFAYPTTRFYDNRREGKPEARAD